MEQDRTDFVLGKTQRILEIMDGMGEIATLSKQKVNENEEYIAKLEKYIHTACAMNCENKTLLVVNLSQKTFFERCNTQIRDLLQQTFDMCNEMYEYANSCTQKLSEINDSLIHKQDEIDKDVIKTYEEEKNKYKSLLQQAKEEIIKENREISLAETELCEEINKSKDDFESIKPELFSLKCELGKQKANEILLKKTLEIMGTDTTKTLNFIESINNNISTKLENLQILQADNEKNENDLINSFSESDNRCKEFETELTNMKQELKMHRLKHDTVEQEQFDLCQNKSALFGSRRVLESSVEDLKTKMGKSIFEQKHCIDLDKATLSEKQELISAKEKGISAMFEGLQTLNMKYEEMDNIINNNMQEVNHFKNATLGIHKELLDIEKIVADFESKILQEKTEIKMYRESLPVKNQILKEVKMLVNEAMENRLKQGEMYTNESESKRSQINDLENTTNEIQMRIDVESHTLRSLKVETKDLQKTKENLKVQELKMTEIQLEIDQIKKMKVNLNEAIAESKTMKKAGVPELNQRETSKENPNKPMKMPLQRPQWDSDHSSLDGESIEDFLKRRKRKYNK